MKQRPHNALADDLGRAIDRAAHWRRDQRALERARQDPSSTVHLVYRSRNLVMAGEQPSALRVPLASLTEDLLASSELVFLGLLPDALEDRVSPLFALDLSDLEESPLLALGLPGEFTELRQLAALVPAADGNLMATSRALFTWHRNHRHCGRCGQTTVIENAGHLRRCIGCGFESFPRTDPAVIMLVHDGGDRCLLGRQASWPEGVFSTLAGFVEPGESLEMAVAREVVEETGVAVTAAHYHSSQPWPFPMSIMLGFWAEARYAGEVSARDQELEQARWFSVPELEQALATREVRLPPPMSIARRLIDDWLAEQSVNS